MPVELENKLRKEYGNNNHAIFGTLNKIVAAKKHKMPHMALGGVTDPGQGEMAPPRPPAPRSMDTSMRQIIPHYGSGGIVFDPNDPSTWEDDQQGGPPPPPGMAMDQPPPVSAGPPPPQFSQQGPSPPQLEDAPPMPQGPPIPRFAGAMPPAPPRPVQQAPPPPPQPVTDAYQRQQQAFQNRKEPGKGRQILAGAMAATRLRGAAPYVSGEAARGRELESLGAQRQAATEEQQNINHTQDRALKTKQMALTDENADLARDQRRELSKPQQTPAQQIQLWKEAGYSDDQAMQIVAAGGKLQPQQPKAPPRPLVTHPEDTIRDPNDPTKVLVQGTPKEVADKESEMQWVAQSQDPNPAISGPAKAKLDALTGQRATVARAGAQARSDVANTPSKPIEPGTREFRVAQDLAYGKLTMQQFRSLTAYSRDTNKKMDIYDKASELNPNFDPAAFERGFKFSSNPKVQQQLASLDNVVAGVPDLIKFSDEAKRAGATILNRFIVPGGVAVGGRKYSDFNTARTAFADELSGGLGYGSATDMSREMGFNMTDPNLSPENFASAVQNVIVPFVARKRKSLTDQMGIYGQSGGQQQSQGGPAPAMVNLQAPDGSVKPVPADQVDHFLKLGAKRVP